MREFREIMDTVVEVMKKIQEEDPLFEGIKFSGMKENVTQADKERLSSEKEEITSFLVTTFEQTPEKYDGFSFDDGYGNTLGFGDGRLTRTYAEGKTHVAQRPSILNTLKSFFSGRGGDAEAVAPDTKSFAVEGNILKAMTTAESLALLRYLGYLEKETKDRETVSRQRKESYVWYLKKKLPNAKFVEDEASDMVHVFVDGIRV
jgi:hypothetical protein